MMDHPPEITITFAIPQRTPEELGAALRKNERHYRLEDGVLRCSDGTQLDAVAIEQDGEFASIVYDGATHKPTPDERRRMSEAPILLKVTGPGGSLDAAIRMLRFGNAMVRAGAAGVLVDSSGASHGASDWRKLNKKPDEGVHWAFVTSTRDPEGELSGVGFGAIFSSGMHCMGHRDVVVQATGDDEVDWFQLNNYCGYLERSGRVPVDGDVLTALSDDGPEARMIPMFRVRYGPSQFPDGPMHNPYGTYVLQYLDPEDPRSMDYLPSSRA